MPIAIVAWLHATAYSIIDGRTRQVGQGTVEYVGVVVMVTLLIAAVALASKGWAPGVGDAMKKALTAAIKKATSGL